jgi:LAS superfamily LD-carboxypeptidase LdcB
MTPVHSTFTEAPPAELADVGRYRDTDRIVRMRADAAVALAGLLTESRAAGVPLTPISGFRSIEYQAGLFQRAIAKHGSEDAAARWVARPGFSEHHTGLAVDLGAEDEPARDVETSFEETQAFHWLNQNAGRFGFELSYPRGNARGINYEPWHWRFVGAPAARKIFAS